MDSLKLADFLFTRIEETITFKQYIAGVNISFSHNEIFGNEYIKVFYTVAGNEIYNDLCKNDQQHFFQKRSDYTFSLSTRKKYSREVEKTLRFIEFKHIYTSLTSYVVLQLEKHLSAETPIKVKGIDFWPQANYCEKFILKGLCDKYDNRYETVMDSSFKADTVQWKHLHDLAERKKRNYNKEKDKFTLTDIEINTTLGVGLDSIRRIVINHEVPIKVEGIKTMNKVNIHTEKLAEALKNAIEHDEYSRKIYELNTYRIILNYLYNYHLLDEKEKILDEQQAVFLKKFIIQPGDVIQLTDNRIVITNSISIDKDNEIKVEYIILKTDLRPSQRKKVIGVDSILYVLEKKDFIEFTKGGYNQHISILKSWMTRKKKKITPLLFQPDLHEVK